MRCGSQAHRQAAWRYAGTHAGTEASPRCGGQARRQVQAGPRGLRQALGGAPGAVGLRARGQR
eukprot:14936084-Alexandrium_andersonii.AAC.1